MPLESVVAPYVPGTVSPPDSNVGAPRVEDVLPEEAARYLVGFDDLMLRSSDDILEMEDHGPSLEPYSDPVLKHDDSKYADFVNDLVQRVLVSFTVTPRDQAAFFFVKKKGGQLRLIVDGRRADRLLRPPPSVSLATPESFAALEVENDQPI